MASLAQKLSDVVGGVFESQGLDRSFGRVTVSDRPDLAQFQCNGAMAASKPPRKTRAKARALSLQNCRRTLISRMWTLQDLVSSILKLAMIIFRPISKKRADLIAKACRITEQEKPLFWITAALISPRRCMSGICARRLSVI